MDLALIVLIVALALYTIVALHPRRFGTSSDMTAIGLALVSFTILIASSAI